VSSRLFACIAAGGTGGHLLPGLAVAEALVDAGHERDSICFVGGRRGPETDDVPAAGFELVALPGRGVPRRFSLDALKAALGIVAGVIRGVAWMGRRRPSVAVVFGGYAAVPCVVGAILWRVPIVVAEQNARASAANRLAGRFAKACAVPFEGTDLPHAVVTGNPVRREIIAVDRARDRGAARAELALPPDRTVIAVFSGSLGSTRVNRAVEELASRWSTRADLAIRHAVGSRDWSDPDVQEAVGSPDGLLYQRLRYEDHVERLYAAADIFVGRAGGSTVAELTVVGLGSVLVPLPIATRDHQTFNAEALVGVGAAVRIPDDQLDADRLASVLSPLLEEPGRLEAMAAAAHRLAHPDAAERVAALADEHARG
jgi:undecaprenyldiphospho-muramoylpentapeptide beta-N-acetylglucosaminyltransferase